ncbi:prepilin-type N-terminal cleavage/methylation domain-containing protein [Synechococcus elongatus IITB4]|uniref:prepilin-type N-terminal cleavage/methylation domain-containing protein n=1 Tax=Synechococcus elongatus TaxID=32046 RepID=UPI0030D4ABC8
MQFFLHRFQQSLRFSRSRRRSQQGVSIVEVLVSAILLVIVATGAIAAIQITAQTSGLGRVNQFTNSRIASDIEQVRAIANGLCRNPDGTFNRNCNLCRTGFSTAIAAQLPPFNENGWPNGSGVRQGTRVDRTTDTSRQTVLTLNYLDLDNNSRPITRVDIIPAAVGDCPCTADNPIASGGGGVTLCL